ncbi:programmed cell death protein 6-like [Dendronephthya gigantea]|uniref:programmed cell death protein 6-like n=1 Tax=Dendronephthya gigantea TaxID=151771 RepID=UPI00106CF99D|nr:programmed cell death protein 6-like [Dendronephthya gigantea]
MSWNQRPPAYNQGYGAAPNPYGQAPPPHFGNAPPPQSHPYQQAHNPYGQPAGHQPYTYPAYNPSMRPQTGPPPGIDMALWQWFQAVDQDNSGGISSDELQRALLNGNWSQFNSETCRLMIGMFDKDKSGTIDIHEFSALWKYIQEWKNCFDRFDTDRSGTIDARELNVAFGSFGYRLSPQFTDLCVRKFDRTNTRSMKFDDFIQCCVMLKTLTDAFRKHDASQTGVVQINYEQFLEMVLNHTLTGI